MSWLDAHESFFMELVADDRIKDLQDSIDAEIPRPDLDARHVRGAAGVLPRRTLVNAT